MCQIIVNQTTVLATSGGNATQIELEGTSTNCKAINILFNGSVLNSTPVMVDHSTSPDSWTVIIDDTFPCQTNIEMEAVCVNVDGTPLNPPCPASGFSFYTDCEILSDNCCIEPSINFEIGECDNLGNVNITFNIQINVIDEDCLPFIFEIDFGDGPNSNSGSQQINSIGQHIFSLSNIYDINNGLNYTALFNYVWPNDCSTIPIGIEIPECPPSNCCPEITSFKHEIKGCIKKGDKCARKVSFIIEGQFCDNTEISIDYGDGNLDDRTRNQGTHLIQFDNEYVSGGSYNVVLSTTSPTNCPVTTININVPECEPNDCPVEPPPPPPPPICPCKICCFLLTNVMLTYFVGWALGAYQGGFDINIPNWNPIRIGYLGVASFIYGFIVFILMRFCFRRRCGKCWECCFFRCMYIALLISMIVILVLFIMSLIFPIFQVPLWWPALAAAFALWVIFGELKNSDKCVKYFTSGECD